MLLLMIQQPYLLVEITQEYLLYDTEFLLGSGMTPVENYIHIKVLYSFTVELVCRLISFGLINNHTSVKGALIGTHIHLSCLNTHQLESNCSN